MALHKRIRIFRLNVPRWLLIVIACLIAVYVLVEINIKPVLMGLSEARVRAAAITTMSDAVLDTLDSDMKYSDLVEVKYDDAGNITMIQANTIVINKIASRAANVAQESIGKLGSVGVGVPLGSILGGQLFSGTGPTIPITVVPAGSVSTQFFSEFTSAGINQTRHRILLELKTRIRVVAPVGSSSVEAVTQVPVAETIIVGKVPDSYVNVDEMDQMLNLLPLK
jgi:sporulation protein YunB